jgi:ABC-type bacteriocin/lantibiotic exporter with double-glycine peptidase domain
LFIFFLLILLGIYNTKAILAALTIATFFFLIIHFFLAHRLTNFGIKKVENDNIFFRLIKDSFENFKIIKIYMKVLFFINQFSKTSVKTANLISIQTFLIQLPKIWMEFFAVSVFLIIISFYQYKQVSLDTNFITLLSLYAAAFFKVIPSINRIIYSSQYLYNQTGTINFLYEELKFVKKKGKLEKNNLENKFKIKFNKEIILSNISYKYPQAKDETLKRINLKIKKNTVVGFVGKSGEGKSTLVDIITGLLEPQKGSVMVDGMNIKHNISEWRKKISYVTQKMTIIHSSIKNNIALGIPENFVNVKKVKESLITAGLNNFHKNINKNFSIKKEILNSGSNFSGGQLQKIGIARALYASSELLVLDEPTSSLDKISSLRLLNNIKKIKKSTTIIIISHSSEILKFCDDVYGILDGKLVKT